jgi:DNA-binding MarR family transcriptional regulator
MRSTSSSSPSDTDLATRLRLAIARSARRLRQASGTGLSPSLTAALSTVECHGPLTPSELAARERVARPTVTRLAIRLEELGLVARAADPVDRRSSLITVTPAGRALLATARTRKDAFLSERLDALDAADRATLERAAALLEGMLE